MCTNNRDADNKREAAEDFIYLMMMIFARRKTADFSPRFIFFPRQFRSLKFMKPSRLKIWVKLAHKSSYDRFDDSENDGDSRKNPAVLMTIYSQRSYYSCKMGDQRFRFPCSPSIPSVAAPALEKDTAAAVDESEHCTNKHLYIIVNLDTASAMTYNDVFFFVFLPQKGNACAHLEWFSG